ncbi:protein split ends [Naviculisporaceae sp. PSN 640]
MDPRQPPPQQHPFSRNANAPAASPFGRPSFPPATSSSQPPYPPASHPPPASSAYAELHSRKPSDPQPYYAPRQYAPEPGPIPPPSSHSRHPSASSITSGPPMNRGMHPPNSPPQQQSQGPNSHPMPGPYGLPPPRPPPVSVGPPTAFPRGRELPALDSLQRPGGGSSMSISSMLGGPAPSRDQAGPPQYGPPQPGHAPGPPYNQPMHASPRMHSNAPPEYAPFRRPQTPDRHRIYDSRDPRAGPAGSPGGAYSTPDVQRYGTPGTYAQRGPPMNAAEQGREPPREPGRMPGNTVPPRPNSQPKAYQNPNIPPSRPMEMGRPPQGEMYPHRDDMRPSEEYNPERPIRGLNYEDPRYFERDRQERERHEMEFRERERRERERTLSGSDAGRHPMHQAEYARQMEQRPPPQVYNRPQDPRDPRDPRDPGHWQRPGYDQPRAPYDPAAHLPRRQEYPVTTGPPYNGHPAYAQPPLERYPPSSHPSHQHPIPPPGQAPGQYESPEQHRLNIMHMERQHHQQHQQQLQQQQHHQQHLQQQQHPHHPPPHLQHQHQIPRTREEQPVPPPSVAYGSVGTGMFGSPRNRSMDELSTTAGQQRNMLGVQEINRKGRISPLPQAVQGAQPQLAGPAGEPGIKSEFGRMFSGIGTGISIASPVPTGAQLPFSGPGLLRREESDGAPQEMAVDSPAKGPGRGKRRKLKDEDTRNEDEATGRMTPIGGRAKKAKTHAHHHHQYVQAPSSSTHTNRTPSHHHHHHHHNLEQASSPALGGNAAAKGVKGGTPVPSPTSALAKDGPTSHPHGAPRSTPAHVNAKATHAPPPPSPPPVVIPKPRIVISNKAVLDSVAHRPRTHLGDVVYEPILKPARLQDPRTGRPPRTGYSTTPKPLPWDLIKDKENSTLTVKVGKQHLTPAVREEITSRRFLWGTDVYTDDSDIIAACIHAGWIRGEWPEDVNIDMLGLDEGVNADPPEQNAKTRRGKTSQAAAAAAAAAEQLALTTKLTEPPKTGPMRVPENRDLLVELLILPTLEKYASTTRFGIKSREWGGYITTTADGEDTKVRQRVTEKHDGISFMITGIQWVTNGATSQNRLRGKARRARIHKALREIEMGPSWGGIFNITTNGNVSGSNEGGNSPAAGGEAKTQASGPKSPAAASDGDKENRPDVGSAQQGASATDAQEQEKGPKKGEPEPQDNEEMVDADVSSAMEAQVNDDARDINAEASPERAEVNTPAEDKRESVALPSAADVAVTEEKKEEGAPTGPQETEPEANDGAAGQAEAKDETAQPATEPATKPAGSNSNTSTDTVEG